MNHDPESTTSVALLILLETTLYVAYVQLLAWRKKQRNGLFFIALALHLSHRRVVLDALSHPSFFGWVLTRIESNYEFIEAHVEPVEAVWEAATPPPSVHPHPLNVTNAIWLHNQLVEHVLDQAPELADRVRKDWFPLYTDSAFGLTASDIRPRLAEPVIEFLSGIYAWQDLDQFSLTPYVRGVAWPEFLSPVPDSPEGELFYEKFPDCIILYRSEISDSDARGLVLDQRTNLARYMPSMWDDQTGRHWASLEHILASWLAEAKTGRWIVDPAREGDMYGPPTAWRHQRWIEEDLDRTILLWDAYLALILAKMGPVQRSAISLDFLPLADEYLLNVTGVEGFERSLLSRMRTPLFTFVAPGLRVPDARMFYETLKEASRRRDTAPDHEDEDENERFNDYAVLLFYADAQVSNRSYHEGDVRHTAPYWIDRFILNDRCGVYLGTYRAAHYADTVSIVAPRKEDETTTVLFAEHSGVVSASMLHPQRELLAEAAGSYQPLRLYHMIALWHDLVVTGKWTVGPQGVEGDIEDIWAMMPDDWRYLW